MEKNNISQSVQVTLLQKQNVSNSKKVQKLYLFMFPPQMLHVCARWKTSGKQCLILNNLFLFAHAFSKTKKGLCVN